MEVVIQAQPVEGKKEEKKEYGKYDKWEVESWADTIVRAEEIKADPEKMKYVCGAGWSGKIWRKDSMVVGGDPVVESLEAMFPSQIAAATLLFIACVKGASWQHTKDVVKSVFRRR